MTRVLRAHSFVLELSVRQTEHLEILARGRRDAYNFALALDRDCYAADLPPADWADLEPGYESPGWNPTRRLSPWDLNKLWPKAAPALYPEHPAPGQPAQLTFADMDLARSAAVRRRGGFPRFRSRYDAHQTVSFAQGIEIRGETIKLPSIKAPLRIKGSTSRLRWFLEHANGAIQKATLVRDGVYAPWRCVLVIEIDIPDVLAPDNRPVVGLDLGIKSFLSLSDGKVIENPRILESMLARLRAAQKSVVRSERDRQKREIEARAAGLLTQSQRLPKGRRHLAKELVITRLHARVVALRNEFHHNTANLLISRYRAIGIEDLNIAGMMRNHKLARVIADVGWASFLSILTYKAAAAGVEIVKAGRWFASSRRCSACGENNPALKDLKIRAWTCPACGVMHDRDINAAANLSPSETQIANARASRLAARKVAAAKRQRQKDRAAKAALTKAVKAEINRLAKHTEKQARHAKRMTQPKPSTLAVTPTDSNARRGSVRPKGTTTVVLPVARTKTLRKQTEARTEQAHAQSTPAQVVSRGALDPPLVDSSV